jgi:hypothetical protein
MDPKEFIVPLILIMVLVVIGAILAGILIENLKRRRIWRERNRDEFDPPKRAR